MLSKFIYKALMVFALAIFAQVGYSQSYVSADVAVDRLEAAIEDLQPNTIGTSNSLTAQPQDLAVALDLRVMSKAKDVLTNQSLSVAKAIMTIEEAVVKSNVSNATQYDAAITKMKNLLSN